MGFVEAVRTCLGKYVTFSGRARRPEYWWFWLAVVLAQAVAAAVDAALFGADTFTAGTATVTADGAETTMAAAQSEAGPVGTVVGLLTFLPLLAANWRRLHDTGRSGLWSLLPVATAMAAGLAGGLLAGLVGMAGAAPGGGALVFSVVVVGALLVSWALVFVWLASPSQPGANRFGPEPAR
jgi:uncharacterized membrane protein YhaH (DUF805 family)